MWNLSGLMKVVLWLAMLYGQSSIHTPAQDFGVPVTQPHPCGAHPSAADSVVSNWYDDWRYPVRPLFYPIVAARRHETGRVAVAVCIMPTGWVGEAVVTSSSGSAQLDAAAIISAGYWHFLPGAFGAGQTPRWKDLAIDFSLPADSFMPATNFGDIKPVDTAHHEFVRAMPDPSIPHSSSYSILAYKHGDEGNAILQLIIEPDGDIGNVRVLQSSGSSQLDAMALISTGYWRYFPATEDGKPVRSLWETRLVFRLGTAPPPKLPGSTGATVPRHS